MSLNPSGNVNFGSGSVYNFKTGSFFANTDYTNSRTIDSIGSANMAVAGISPAESVNYANTKPITSNEYLSSIVATGTNPNFGNVSQPNIFVGQIGAGIETTDFNRAFVNSPSIIPKNPLIPKSSISSGVPIFSGSVPVNTGVSIDPLTGIPYGNTRISSGSNGGTGNLMPNAPIRATRKFVFFSFK